MLLDANSALYVSLTKKPKYSDLDELRELNAPLFNWLARNCQYKRMNHLNDESIPIALENVMEIEMKNMMHSEFWQLASVTVGKWHNDSFKCKTYESESEHELLEKINSILAKNSGRVVIDNPSYAVSFLLKKMTVYGIVYATPFVKYITAPVYAKKDTFIGINEIYNFQNDYRDVSLEIMLNEFDIDIARMEESHDGEISDCEKMYLICDKISKILKSI